SGALRELGVGSDCHCGACLAARPLRAGAARARDPIVAGVFGMCGGDWGLVARRASSLTKDIRDMLEPGGRLACRIRAEWYLRSRWRPSLQSPSLTARGRRKAPSHRT